MNPLTQVRAQQRDHHGVADIPDGDIRKETGVAIERFVQGQVKLWEVGTAAQQDTGTQAQVGRCHRRVAEGPRTTLACGDWLLHSARVGGELGIEMK